MIYKFDIDTETLSLFIDLEVEGANWKLYGCSIGVHPVTDEIYMSLYHEFGTPTYITRRYSPSGEKIRDYEMISNYWFPSLPLFAIPNEHSGVESIIQNVQENCEIEYYTLSGIKITNPSPGIYLRKQGRKVEKWIVHWFYNRDNIFVILSY